MKQASNILFAIWQKLTGREEHLRQRITPRIPAEADFPAGTEFMVCESSVPLARVPQDGKAIWVNWFGGVPRHFDVTWLRVDNNQPAESFEAWAMLVADSLPKK